MNRAVMFGSVSRFFVFPPWNINLISCHGNNFVRKLLQKCASNETSCPPGFNAGGTINTSAITPVDIYLYIRLKRNENN